MTTYEETRYLHFMTGEGEDGGKLLRTLSAFERSKLLHASVRGERSSGCGSARWGANRHGKHVARGDIRGGGGEETLGVRRIQFYHLKTV